MFKIFYISQHQKNKIDLNKLMIVIQTNNL